jgi:hypothetical protein
MGQTGDNQNWHFCSKWEIRKIRRSEKILITSSVLSFGIFEYYLSRSKSDEKMPDSEPLVNVSAMEILISVAPLVLIACLSNIMRLDIASPIVVSTIRTFVQLSILSFILDPIFSRGVDLWWLVVGYCFLMILLASYEGSTRSKYYVDGQFWMVFCPMFINVVAVALFAFFVVIKPHPRWGRFRRICYIMLSNNNESND